MSKKNPANDNFFNYEVTVRAFQELIDLLNSEKIAIKKEDVTTIEKTFARKVDLIDFLEAQKRLIADFPKLKDSLTQEQVNNLRNLAQELQATSNANGKELSKAIYINELLLKTIYDVVAQKTGPVKTYTKYGKQNDKSFKNNPPFVSVSQDI